MKSIKRRDKLYKEWQKDKVNLKLKENYIKYRNNLNKLIDITKLNHHKYQIEKNKNNSQKLWKTIKNITNTNNRPTIIKQLQSKNGNDVYSSEEISNTFNDFFSNVGQELAQNIGKPPVSTPPRVINPCSFFLKPTDENEISKIILNLKNNKTPGIDGIKAETLKAIYKEIATPLCYIINNVMESGICPIEFKITVIKPLHKKGDKTLPSNYRPISLVTNYAKIFEKIIKIRLKLFLEKHKIIADNQFGFQSGKSAEGAIASLTQKMYEAIDNSQPAIGVFLDLAKAFDTVDHQQLLGSLEDVGIRGVAHNLFKSYLSDRKQCVKIDDTYSSFELIKCGVPQGTVLGPILFILYINNLLTIGTSGHIISFADDTVILYTSSSWEDLKLKIQSEMNNIIDWFNHKLLTVNFDKTVFLPITSYKNKLPQYNTLQIINHNKMITLKRTENVKYLGIIIDCHLRWNDHVNNTVNTIRTFLGRFRYLAKILPLHHLKMLYFALVDSRIAYGIIGWGGITNVYLEKLNTLQKYFLKILLRKDRTYPSDSLYKEARILDIRQIFFLKAVCFLHKNRRHTDFLSHDYPTRAKYSNKVKTPSANKTVGTKCLAFLGPRFINIISDSYLFNISNSETYYRNNVKSLEH